MSALTRTTVARIITIVGELRGWHWIVVGGAATLVALRRRRKRKEQQS
jgi:hypothetical protein